MPERNFEYPCVLDITKNCPTSCKLHQLSVRQILKLAFDRGSTPEEEVALLRSGTQEELQILRTLSANRLRQAGKIEECPNHTPNDLKIKNK